MGTVGAGIAGFSFESIRRYPLSYIGLAAIGVTFISVALEQDSQG
tara:strand:- start:5 stop:139 length:135 start_codon:yes stop_codon:yes gene_type:complete